MDQRLIAEDLQHLLQTRFVGSEIKYVSSNLQPITHRKQGYMSIQFRLSIRYIKDGFENLENFFVKTKPVELPENHPANSNTNYEKETFIYDVLLKEFEKLGYDNSFAPKCYLCLNGDTIILEEMYEKGFQVPERQTYYDISKMRCLLNSLALFHAGSFCYEKTKSLQNDPDHSPPINAALFNQHMHGKCFGFNFFKKSIPSFLALLDYVPRNQEYRTKFKHWLKIAEFGKIFLENHNYKKTIIHGDLWSNNMLFKTSNNVTESCYLIDYQCCTYFYPAYDVLLATHHNTSEEFSRNYLGILYKYYYGTFYKTVQKYGYDPNEFMSWEDFKSTLKLCKMDAMLQVAAVNSTVFIPADFLPNHMNNIELKARMAGMSVEEQMKRFRVYFCALAYKHNPIFRNNLNKNLDALFAALQQRYSANI